MAVQSKVLPSTASCLSQLSHTVSILKAIIKQERSNKETKIGSTYVNIQMTVTNAVQYFLLGNWFCHHTCKWF